MRVNKKELKKIIQEEYQKVLAEYISEDAAQFAQQQNKAGKGPSDNTAMVAKAVLDFEEALETFTDVTPEVQSALDALSSALGLATSAGFDTVSLAEQPTLPSETFAEGEGQSRGLDEAGRYHQGQETPSDDPRIAEMRAAVSQLGELQFDSLEDDAQSWVDDAVRNLSKAIDEILYQREVGNV